MKKLTASSNEVNKKKEAAEGFKVELEKAQVAIAERSEVVNRDLAGAEPALRAAEKLVQGIKAAQINELKAFQRPPAKVAQAMEAVCILFLNTAKKIDWATCKATFTKPGFT